MIIVIFKFDGRSSAVVLLNPHTTQEKRIYDEESEFPVSFTIDQYNRKIYFGNEKLLVTNMMMQREEDETFISLLNNETITELNITRFVDFYVDDDRLYWIEDWTRIRSSDFDGRDLVLHVRRNC